MSTASLKRQSARQAAEEYGIDVSLLEDNLRKTPAERLRQHRIALSTVLALREAMGNGNGRP